MRDDFLEKTKKTLAHRVGFKCSNPKCRKPTSGPSDEGLEKYINIGVASHICAASQGGPRYDILMSPEIRSSYENGIWLCQTCSKLIDSDSTRFTNELLSIWKKSAEIAAFSELSTSNYSPDSFNEDKNLIRFYIQCFDRPAFQHPIVQEGKMEDFQKAIEDTMIALNTGILKTRNGEILKKSEGKSLITNDSWREKFNVITDMLVAIKQKLEIGKTDGVFWSDENGYYCFSDIGIAVWFDKTREEILKILFSVCEEAEINSNLTFPRTRYIG